jgi:hypothetical protein
VLEEEGFFAPKEKTLPTESDSSNSHSHGGNLSDNRRECNDSKRSRRKRNF